MSRSRAGRPKDLKRLFSRSRVAATKGGGSSHRQREVEHSVALIAEPVRQRYARSLRGRLGAVSAAHPSAVAAGQEMLLAGGRQLMPRSVHRRFLCV